MDLVPPPRVDRPSARGRDGASTDATRRPVLTVSHWVAVGAAVLVVSAVATLAFVLSRSGEGAPPDGTYRLVARDSALCLTFAGPGSAATAPSDPSASPSPHPVHLTTCPDAGGPGGDVATAPGAGSGQASGTGPSGAGGDSGPGLGAGLGAATGTGIDGPAGHWMVRPADGTTQLMLHPADGAGLCLTVTGRTATSPVALEPCRSSGAQTWSLRQVGRSDFFQVVADQGRRCLDATTVDGVLVAVEKMCSSEPSQQWRFDPAD